MDLPNQNRKTNHIVEILGKLRIRYVRGSFNLQKNPDLVIEMILNNMKIEGQEVKRQEFLNLINGSNTGKQ